MLSIRKRSERPNTRYFVTHVKQRANSSDFIVRVFPLAFNYIRYSPNYTISNENTECSGSNVCILREWSSALDATRVCQIKMPLYAQRKSAVVKVANQISSLFRIQHVAQFQCQSDGHRPTMKNAYP